MSTFITKRATDVYAESIRQGCEHRMAMAKACGSVEGSLLLLVYDIKSALSDLEQGRADWAKRRLGYALEQLGPLTR